MVLALVGGSPALADAPSIEMTVAPELDSDLQPITKLTYANDELDSLFQRMTELGDDWCRMLDGELEEDKQRGKEFIRRDIYYKGACRRCKLNVIAGCWNYFRMNDKHPEDDFNLVKTLLPAQQYDCYSVGFLQPYMMHNILGCSTLTTLDFDWRIQYAHKQMLDGFGEQKMGETESLLEFLSQLQIAYVAHMSQPRSTHTTVPNTFCADEQRDSCWSHLLQFQQKMGSLQRVQLNLAALHEASIIATPAEVPKVFYLSNAIENIYTSEEEFGRMMARLDEALVPGQRTFLIHHVGSYRYFGLYEMIKKEEGFDLITRCRDEYVATATNRTAPTYETWFDAIATAAEPMPRCHDLLAPIDGDSPP